MIRLRDLLQHEDVVCALGAGTESQAVRRVNNEILRTDQVAPVVAGCDGVLNAFELMESMIAAGAAAVHFEDQLSPEQRHGHPGGKVLIPTGQHIETLTAARLAADLHGVPSLVMARTAADSASLLTSDAGERDHEFLTGERTAEGYYRARLDDGSITQFQKELAALGYRFQCVTPAGSGALHEPVLELQPLG